MNNITISKPDLEFRLNLTDHLAETKKMFQTGHFYKMPWSAICDLFVAYFKTNFRDIKDTSGFSFGEFKTYTIKEWRLKLYNEYLNLDEKLSNLSQDDPKRSKIEFKWDKINTESKRLSVLNDLFPHGIDLGFHRLSIDCINKSAIIIDYDNNQFIDSLDKKTGKREQVKHFKSLVQPEMITDKLYRMGCNFIIYSSFSSTTSHPKFRVVLPLDFPVNKDDSTMIKECVINLLTIFPNVDDFTHNLVDYTSFEMSRFFYMPVNHIDKFQDIEKYDTYKTGLINFKAPDCWLSYRNSDHYISTELLHEYRHKIMKKNPRSWKGIEYIDSVRKNFSHTS
jgi:hypothetical protein